MGFFKFRKYEDAPAKESLLLGNHSSDVYEEAYRTLSANIEHVAEEQKLQTLLITSAIGNEGKTTSAINLSLVLSGQKKKVLLINADHQNKKFNTIFNVQKDKFGFFDVVDHLNDLENNVRHIQNTNIDILFSGKNKKVSILEVRAFLSAVEKVYDYIIIAAPTVNTTADTAILAQCVDGVLLVVKQNGAASEEVLSAVQELRLVGANIIGTIFSHCNSLRSKTVLRKYNRLYMK
jgi:capsular exopolysaccharide synthesis family protein